ncbi:MAG TPA: hypothetical protein VFB90_09210 [Dehalococcoidia bacterium]|nr:hypothetical protein [Dehalococcoidia bacterium]
MRFIFGLLLGLALGAGMGLLLAPQAATPRRSAGRAPAPQPIEDL